MLRNGIRLTRRRVGYWIWSNRRSLRYREQVDQDQDDKDRDHVPKVIYIDEQLFIYPALTTNDRKHSGEKASRLLIGDAEVDEL